jgi:acetyl esterase/lipase
VSSGGRLLALLLAAAVSGCAGASGEADDVCRAERVPDPVDAATWSLGVQVPDGSGGTVHADVRWPDLTANAGSWPIALVIQGTWSPVGTPVDRTTARVDPTAGIVSIHLDLPGNGRTPGTNDRRGAGSRAAVAAVLRWAAGDTADLGGCTLPERIPAAAPERLFVVGTSNGGNLAVATLADPEAALPPVAGLVAWETPAGPQFTNVELGAEPTVYTPGTCTYGGAVGIVCEMPADELVAVESDGGTTLCFDRDGDGACGAPDVVVQGTEDLDTGAIMLSPALRRLAAARELSLPGFASEETAADWWAERDAARLAGALVAAQPELPILLLASATDHVQTLPDHPHVFGLGEALQGAGAAWTRLNPGTAWLPELSEENPPNAPLRLDDPTGSLVSEAAEEPLAELLAAAVLELSERHQTGEW